MHSLNVRVRKGALGGAMRTACALQREAIAASGAEVPPYLDGVQPRVVEAVNRIAAAAEPGSWVAVEASVAQEPLRGWSVSLLVAIEPPDAEASA
jgi:hypothetical protein